MYFHFLLIAQCALLWSFVESEQSIGKASILILKRLFYRCLEVEPQIQCSTEWFANEESEIDGQ